MDLELTAEERALAELCRDFARQEIEPNAARYWQEERCPTEVLQIGRAHV